MFNARFPLLRSLPLAPARSFARPLLRSSPISAPPTRCALPYTSIPRQQIRTFIPKPPPVVVIPTGGGPRGGRQYRRFKGRRNFHELWKNPNARKLAGAGAVGAGTFYVYNLETVPVSGRRRFNCISAANEEEMAKEMFEETIQSFQGKILPKRSRAARQVQKVLDRLIPVTGLEDVDWEVFVVKDDTMKNAFVIPGGKVFVFTGILPICGDEEGLAAVMAHEIAHTIARHSAERLSKYFIVIGAFVIASFTMGIDPGPFGRMLIDLTLLRPGSRKQEAEADYIGLMLMAQACYNPAKAVTLWERMEKSEAVAVPQFLSTHPANRTRISNIERWLAEANEKRNMSDCASTMEYATAFKKQFDYPSWPSDH